MRTFKVSADWIEYAHGPGAESGYPLAIQLCDLPRNGRGQTEIPLERMDLIFEVKDVAELYTCGEDKDLQACRVVARCKRILNGWRP